MIKPYLIEIRMMGSPKYMTRELIYDIHKKFRVRGAVKHRPVPHMSLFGPFGCRSLRDVIHTIGEIGSEFSELHYEIDGFDYFEIKKKFLFITTSTRKNVIFLKIRPTKELKEFRHKLAKNLLKITNAQDHDCDSKDKFKFHATVAMKDIHQKFDEIWEYLKDYEMRTQGVSYRITLLKQGKIVYEYDMPTKRLLNRRQSLKRTRNKRF